MLNSLKKELKYIEGGYWAYALLITLQGTGEETTLRAHISVVLLLELC